MVANFSPEDLLIILCVQMSRDFCYKREQLAKICDIAELIYACQALDWEQVIEQAHRLGSTRMLLLNLFLASELLEAALPEEVLLKIRADASLRALALQVCDRLWQCGPLRHDNDEGAAALTRNHIFQEADVSESPFKKLVEIAIFHFRMRERFRDNFPFILYLFKLAVTPNETDRAIISLPAFLSSLYYLLKPIRLAEKYRLKLWQNFLKRMAK
jgi:hypothetical protein